MRPRLTPLLTLSYLLGIGLLSVELLSDRLTLSAMTGVVLVTLSSLGFMVSLRRMQASAFRSAMSNYADRQMRLETRPQPSFDAPSTVL